MQFALLLPLLLQGPGSSTAAVVINEFSYDDTSTDDEEYVELYNRSAAAVDIGNWVLEASDLTGPNLSYTIPAGTMLPAGGFYVLGSALVLNVNQIVGVNNLWENDNESLTLKDAMGAVVDTLVYESSKGIWNPALPEGPGVYGNLTTTSGAPSPQAWARVRDGYDSNNNGLDFAHLPRTPGATNAMAPALPIADNFDAPPPGTPSILFSGSFVDPVIVDPTLGGGVNPNAIPNSPQGGNALVLWDPAGGGNAGPLLTSVGDQFDIDGYFYFATAPHTPIGNDQYETWSIGVGTTDTFGNHPDPGGLLAGSGVTGIVQANTGVAWTYVRLTDDPSGAATGVLYLVDYNDGGAAGHVVAASVTLTPGANDGWQRLRFRANGRNFEGWFGGTPGLNDGTHFSGISTMRVLGPVYFQYREFVTVNAETRSLTLDDLRVSRHGPGIVPLAPPTQCVGSGGCAPKIGWNGGTPIGFSAGPYAVTLHDAFAPGSAILVIGITSGPPFPIDVAAIFGAGNPGNCYTLNDPLVLVVVPVAGAGGCEGTTQIPISLAGVPPGGPIFAHWVSFDPGSSLGIPLATSDGFALTVQ